MAAVCPIACIRARIYRAIVNVRSARVREEVNKKSSSDGISTAALRATKIMHVSRALIPEYLLEEEIGAT